jgi:hypothetical protein
MDRSSVFCLLALLSTKMSRSGAFCVLALLTAITGVQFWFGCANIIASATNFNLSCGSTWGNLRIWIQGIGIFYVVVSTMMTIVCIACLVSLCLRDDGDVYYATVKTIGLKTLSVNGFASFLVSVWAISAKFNLPKEPECLTQWQAKNPHLLDMLTVHAILGGVEVALLAFLCGFGCCVVFRTLRG